MSAVAWRKSRLSLRAGIGVRTFNARPFQAALVDAGIRQIVQRDLFGRSVSLGKLLADGLSGIVADYPAVFKDVRGQGLFLGIELSNHFARRGHLVRDTLLRHGVLTEIESGIFNRKVRKEGRVNETIRLTPPLTVVEETLNLAIARIRACACVLDADMLRAA